MMKGFRLTIGRYTNLGLGQPKAIDE